MKPRSLNFLTTLSTAILYLPPAAAAELINPITNETIRQSAPQATFPGMQIRAVASQKIDDSGQPKPSEPGPNFLDALAAETAYEVTGKSRDPIEECAAENLATSQFSQVRRLRFQLYEWPDQAQFARLAILQYDFTGAQPAGSCWLIGLLIRLVKQASGWQPEAQFLLGDHHHSEIYRIDLIDLTGDGGNDLILESNYGGAGTTGAFCRIFDLRRGTFHELIKIVSFREHGILDRFTQVLDTQSTRQSRGSRFCFQKLTQFEKGKLFNPARRTRPCYPAGEGVDERETANLSQRPTP